jgi:hypothetical protein
MAWDDRASVYNVPTHSKGMSGFEDYGVFFKELEILDIDYSIRPVYYPIASHSYTLSSASINIIFPYYFVPYLPV